MARTLMDNQLGLPSSVDSMSFSSSSSISNLDRLSIPLPPPVSTIKNLSLDRAELTASTCATLLGETHHEGRTSRVRKEEEIGREHYPLVSKARDYWAPKKDRSILLPLCHEIKLTLSPTSNLRLNSCLHVALIGDC
ncbi:unnamed protein product [Musa banksii]